jgi:alpha-galactosidase
MLIDTCASGGRRLDLETLRRAVPLLRSDYIMEPVGQQGHTYGLSFWIPMFGTGGRIDNPYVFRSQMCYFHIACIDVRRTDLDDAMMRKVTDERREIGKYWLGDYYPLTPYNLDGDRWIAWQFDRPDLGEGMVQAFRRAESVYTGARFKLSALDPDATYTVQNLDETGSHEFTGRELMDKGLLVSIDALPGAAVVTYKRK